MWYTFTLYTVHYTVYSVHSTPSIQISLYTMQTIGMWIYNVYAIGNDSFSIFSWLWSLQYRYTGRHHCVISNRLYDYSEDRDGVG